MDEGESVKHLRLRIKAVQDQFQPKNTCLATRTTILFLLLSCFPMRTQGMCVSRRRILAGALATNISINYSKQSAAITDDIVKQLRPATDDQPQIPLPMANDPNLRPNLDDLQGLIYLKNERNERPIAGSVIMVTVSNKDGQILAGAKLPANRLPIRFRLNERNRLSDSWVEALRSEDLVVTARVCLEVVERVQCETKQQVATGTSKLLRLKQDAGTVMVRPGVSLGLE